MYRVSNYVGDLISDADVPTKMKRLSLVDLIPFCSQ